MERHKESERRKKHISPKMKAVMKDNWKAQKLRKAGKSAADEQATNSFSSRPQKYLKRQAPAQGGVRIISFLRRNFLTKSALRKISPLFYTYNSDCAKTVI
jgi:hypothetical protein